LTIRLAVEDVIVSCYLPSNGTAAVGSDGSEKPASISEEAVKVLDSEIGVLRELRSDGRVAGRKLAEELEVFVSNGCKMANEECSLPERDYILGAPRDYELGLGVRVLSVVVVVVGSLKHGVSDKRWLW
jgi:hypothetical protein